MTLHFSHPLFWLLIAAALPLAIHLFARMKPREKEFSSLTFLRKAIRHQSRMRKPVDLLLLLLRTLAFFALAAAFLLPYLSGQFTEEKGTRNVILVVDRSASLAASDGMESRIGRAGKFAENLVNGLRSSDLLNLIWIDANPESLFQKSSPAKNMVIRELQRIHTSQEEGSPEKALQLALQQAKEAADNVSTEIYIISDFQSSNWNREELFRILPDSLSVQYVSVAQSPKIANSAVSDLRMHPAAPLYEQAVTVQAELSNFGDTPLRATAHLEAGPLRTSQVCEIPPNEKTVVHFPLTAPDHGQEWLITVSLDNDSFPSDDSRSMVVPLKKSLKADIVVTDPARMGYMLKALDSLPFLHIQTAAGLSVDTPEFIIWHQPAKEDLEQIQLLANEGDVVLIIPDFAGDDTANTLMGAAEPLRAESEYAPDAAGWAMKAANPDDPSLSLFSGDRMVSVFRGNIFQRLNKGLGTQWPETTHVLVSYEDGVPAITRRILGRGALILWNTPVTQRDSTWGVSPHFLPYLGELLLSSRRDGHAGKNTVPGVDFVEWELPPTTRPEDIQLYSPDKKLQPVHILGNPKGNTVLKAMNPAAPGIYEWKNIRENNLTQHRSPVNFPIIESNLSIMDNDRLSTGILPMEQAEGNTLAAKQYQLWPWLILASLLALLAELLISSALSRKSKSGEEALSATRTSSPSES